MRHEERVARAFPACEVATARDGVEEREEVGKKLKSFTIALTVEGEIKIEDGAINLLVETTAARAEDGFGHSTMRSDVGAPLSDFESPEQAEAWAERTFHELRARLRAALLSEATLTLTDEAHAALDHLGTGEANIEGLIQDHARSTERRLRERFDTHRPGQFSQWTRTQLTQAVKVAAHSLPKDERTIARTAERLRKSHPDKAPKTSAGLKQMLRRFNVEWSEVSG